MGGILCEEHEPPVLGSLATGGVDTKAFPWCGFQLPHCLPLPWMRQMSRKQGVRNAATLPRWLGHSAG